MGCASSTPMIQTSGSEMLKAASHAATDATKSAEDAVEGLKDTVGKTFETAKESVTTTMESVKHEVENVVKEKSEMMEGATNSLMEKLHLKQTENDGNSASNKVNEENIGKKETDALKNQLEENFKTSDSNNDTPHGQSETAKDMKEHATASTDIETDSLKTSTPEPEIEQALAKSHHNQESDNDNPPTPKPTLDELENLTAELLQQSQKPISDDDTTLVNDIVISNETLMPVMHENIKTVDSNTIKSLTADNYNTIKDNEPTAAALMNTDIKSITNEHKTPFVLNISPLTLATAAIVTATAAPVVPLQIVNKRENIKKAKVQQKEEKVKKKIVSACVEKRPRTTEWEKFADMLAQIRKFNPHDAYRRGSTHMKFGGGHIRERSFLGHHLRNAADDDGSDTNCNIRVSPQNSRRSSARLRGREPHLPDRPNTGNNRKTHQDVATHNAGGNYVHKMRRNSNINAVATGRKFYFNPARSRVNDFVSSTSLNQASLQNTVITPLPYAPHSSSYESVKSPVNSRSHHSRSEMITLPPLEYPERSKSLSQQEPMAHKHQHHHLAGFADHNGSMPTQSDHFNFDTPILTRQSSNTSFYSTSSHVEYIQNFRSSNLDVRLPPTIHPPVKNTSSFLTTPRGTPFGLTKSYTDLYFSPTCNKENRPRNAVTVKSPFRVRKNLNDDSKKPHK